MDEARLVALGADLDGAVFRDRREQQERRAGDEGDGLRVEVTAHLRAGDRIGLGQSFRSSATEVMWAIALVLSCTRTLPLLRMTRN